MGGQRRRKPGVMGRLKPALSERWITTNRLKRKKEHCRWRQKQIGIEAGKVLTCARNQKYRV